MRPFSCSSILYAILIAVILAALPGTIHKIIQTGDPYLFTERFFHDILARLSGPGRLRFILQPTVAIILGARGGMKDAQTGIPPFLRALVTHKMLREHLLRNALAALRSLVAIAVLLDFISQFLILREIRPGAALVLGPVLIGLPYALSCALSNRIWHWNHRTPAPQTR